MQRDFDILVIGGGHAGIEAALAAVRMGSHVGLVTMDRSRLALMSCNPAIGGIGKSHIVKEVDALGGLMGEAIDATGIQFRRLNLSRGPAVWSTRAQADRRAYTRFVSGFVQSQSGLEIIEGTAGVIVTDRNRAAGLVTEDGHEISASALVLCSGTFLDGLIHIGPRRIPAGRRDEPAAVKLSDSLRQLGFEVGRLKTGTPPRVDGSTIDYSKCQVQPGEEPPPWFSHRSTPRRFEQTPCHLTYTSAETRELITRHSHLSPIFSGQIQSTGPRYCPSIEDKYHRFADKERHQVFLEPEGNGTNEVYPNGFSTALPEEIQRQAIRTIVGLERAEMTQPGYAIEYDYCPPYQIRPSLETKLLRGLFLAGQINGTSGYEEAAGQGLIAGINASLYLAGEEPLIIDRSEAYIGVMTDDLCTRSISEPYRMFTSRAEYRLALREDNARDRLAKYARRYGLVDSIELDDFNMIRRKTDMAAQAFEKIVIAVDQLGALGDRFEKADYTTLANLIRQPNISIEQAAELVTRFDGRFGDSPEVIRRAAIRIRYQGYLDKQQREVDRFKRLEAVPIPEDFRYELLGGLKTEARQRLIRFRPRSLGQAGRLEGVTPGDIAVLSVHLKRHGVELP